MGRYYLVASYYDSFNKSYRNENIIKKLNGINLSSLVEIDKFTSNFEKIKILDMIEKELGIMGINHLAIKYFYSNDDNKFYPYRVIYGNELFNECTKSVVKNKVMINNKCRETYFVSSNNKLYRQKMEKLMKLIKGENASFDKFREFYSLDNELSFLVKRYINSSYDNELEKERDLKNIILEFSRYKTFRGWIIEQEKKKNNTLSYTYKSSDKNVVYKDKQSKNKGEVLSIEQNISLYEKEFEKEHGISYDEYKTMEYNDLNEEFLDVDEMDEMFDYDNSRVVRKRH